MVKPMKTKNSIKIYTDKELLDNLESYLKKRREYVKKFEAEQLKQAGLTKQSLEKLKSSSTSADPELRKYVFATRADVARAVAEGLEDDIKEIKAYKKKAKKVRV